MHWILIPILMGMLAVSVGTVLFQRDTLAAIAHIPSNPEHTRHYRTIITQLERLAYAVHTYQHQHEGVPPPPGPLGSQSALADVGYAFTLPHYMIGLEWHLGAAAEGHIALCATSGSPIPESAHIVFGRSRSELGWGAADCSSLGQFTAGFSVPLITLPPAELPPAETPPEGEGPIGGGAGSPDEDPVEGTAPPEEPTLEDYCPGTTPGDEKLRKKYAASIQPDLRKLLSAIHLFQLTHLGAPPHPGNIRNHGQIKALGFKSKMKPYDDMAWLLGSASGGRLQLCVVYPQPMPRYACEGLVRARTQMGWGVSACAQPNSVGMALPLLGGSTQADAYRDALRDALAL